MGLLTALVTGGSPFAAGPDWNDERLWSAGSGTWQPGFGGVYRTTTGITVTPDLAFQVSCFFHGVRLIAEVVGTLPIILYRRRGDDQRERARDHPLWEILHDQPCGWMDIESFKEVMTAYQVAWNNAFAEIVSGPRGWVEELRPHPPQRVTVRQLPNRRLVYDVVDLTGQRRTIPQERMFHLRGFGLDAVVPTPLLRLAREALSLWIAHERFQGLYFKQGAQPSLGLQHPKTLSKEAQDRLKASVQENVEGLSNMHRVLVAEEGMTIKEFGFTARESQMNESRRELVLDVARWLNVPEHMFRAGKQPTYASVEQFAREFVDYTLRPPCNRWQGAIRRQLIADERDSVYAEFLFDALLDGNPKDRAEVYRVATGGRPWMRPSEVRRQQNLPPDDTLDREPPQGAAVADRRPADARPAPMPGPADDRDDDEPGPSERRRREARAVIPRRVRLAIEQAAARLVAIEAKNVTRKAAQLAARPDEWAAWLGEFYGHEYPALLGEHLQLEPVLIAGYCLGHREAVSRRGLEALQDWQREGAGQLAALALDEDSAAAAMGGEPR